MIGKRAQPHDRDQILADEFNELKPATECGECGMMVEPHEYHPYAACLMFKACNSSESVRLNLEAVRAHGAAAKERGILGSISAILASHKHWRLRKQPERVVRLLAYKVGGDLYGGYVRLRSDWWHIREQNRSLDTFLKQYEPAEAAHG